MRSGLDRAFICGLGWIAFIVVRSGLDSLYNYEDNTP